MLPWGYKCLPMMLEDLLRHPDPPPPQGHLYRDRHLIYKKRKNVFREVRNFFLTRGTEPGFIRTQHFCEFRTSPIPVPHRSGISVRNISFLPGVRVCPCRSIRFRVSMSVQPPSTPCPTDSVRSGRNLIPCLTHPHPTGHDLLRVYFLSVLFSCSWGCLR